MKKLILLFIFISLIFTGCSLPIYKANKEVKPKPEVKVIREVKNYGKWAPENPNTLTQEEALQVGKKIAEGMTEIYAIETEEQLNIWLDKFFVHPDGYKQLYLEIMFANNREFISNEIKDDSVTKLDVEESSFIYDGLLLTKLKDKDTQKVYSYDVKVKYEIKKDRDDNQYKLIFMEAYPAK